MEKDEDDLAAYVMSGTMTFVLLSAAERPGYLLGCHYECLMWLSRYMDRKPNGELFNLWVRHFMQLNKENIDNNRPLDFNLRATKEKGII